MPYYTFRCARCGNESRASRAAGQVAPRYCSIQCTRDRLSVTCSACAAVFEVKRSHAARARFCSRECRDSGLRRERQAEIEARFGAPITDLLHRLYHVEKMGIRAIAKRLGVSDRNLWEWFNSLGIERRERSEAVRLQWADNDERRASASEKARAWAEQNPEQVQRTSARGNLALQQQSGPTSLERIMMEALDGAGLEYEYQYVVGDKFACDFAFPQHGLIVECDGDYWHSLPRQMRTDASKDAYLRACGLRVLRFKGSRILSDIEGCVGEIHAALMPLS